MKLFKNCFITAAALIFAVIVMLTGCAVHGTGTDAGENKEAEAESVPSCSSRQSPRKSFFSSDIPLFCVDSAFSEG